MKAITSVYYVMILTVKLIFLLMISYLPNIFKSTVLHILGDYLCVFFSIDITLTARHVCKCISACILRLSKTCGGLNALGVTILWSTLSVETNPLNFKKCKISTKYGSTLGVDPTTHDKCLLKALKFIQFRWNSPEEKVPKKIKNKWKNVIL